MLPLAPLPLQPTILRYNDEEYRSLIKKEAGWSREETDYLMELCHRLELRFIVIADRYEVCAQRRGGWGGGGRQGRGVVCASVQRWQFGGGKLGGAAAVVVLAPPARPYSVPASRSGDSLHPPRSLPAALRRLPTTPRSTHPP